MTADEEIRRGNEAARLMNEPLMKAAFDGIRTGIVGAMEQTKLADHKTQHELVVMLQLLARLKGSLETHIQTGKLAHIQKETLAQKAKNALRRVR